MRLIDAPELIEKFDTDGRVLDPIEVRMQILLEPTAYDVDAVIAQIKERTAFLSDCTKYGNATKEQQEKSYDTMMMYEVADLIDDLIEIIKDGGIKNES